MSYLPRISHLDVSGYEMYPGSSTADGLHRDLHPGLTLVVGANGLGKTTLVTLLRHMCAGPARLVNRSGGAFEAGGLRTTAVDVETFADRVGDRAREASARVVMKVAGSSFAVTRSLRNLELTSLIVDEVEKNPTEGEFQAIVVAAAEVPDYAHWLLLIDYLVFVSEDRSEPFWDRNIQRHLLRVLTREATAAGALAQAESRHISADSEFRNARVQLNRHRQRFEAQAAKVAGTGDVKAELLRISGAKRAVDAEIAELEAQLEDARDRSRQATQEYEVAGVELQLGLDALEAARFALIESAMPTQEDVVRYLSARLVTSQACPVCSQEGGDIASRLADSSCFLCGLTHQTNGSATHEGVTKLESQVQRAETAVEANAARRAERREHLHHIEASLAARRSRRADLESRIRGLRAQLPQGSTDLGSSVALIADLEADLAGLRSDLDASRDQLQTLIETTNEAVRAKQDDIKRVFDRVATMFLVEQCHLVPHQTSVKIGQEGERFDIQGFDLALGSSTESGESRRDARDEVSESQRIFIDIAFRIALVDTCVTSNAGTMVVDAPEGSLDAVFSSNAATLLFAFVSPTRAARHLVVASNLIEGSMLPKLAELAGLEGESDSRLINLLELAAPTAAVRERGEKYREVLRRALSSVSRGAQ